MKQGGSNVPSPWEAMLPIGRVKLPLFGGNLTISQPAGAFERRTAPALPWVPDWSDQAAVRGPVIEERDNEIADQSESKNRLQWHFTQLAVRLTNLPTVSDVEEDHHPRNTRRNLHTALTTQFHQLAIPRGLGTKPDRMIQVYTIHARFMKGGHCRFGVHRRRPRTHECMIR